MPACAVGIWDRAAARLEHLQRKACSVQAADIVRVVGIGRNEYISIMNQCKAKKLLWRVNKAIVKEFLPTEPLPPNTMQPWWIARVVNLSECQCIHGAQCLPPLCVQLLPCTSDLFQGPAPGMRGAWCMFCLNTRLLLTVVSAVCFDCRCAWPLFCGYGRMQ